VRLLECGQWSQEPARRLDLKRVNGGLLVQDADLALVKEMKVVSQRQPTEAELRDLLFAWRVAKFVKSNAIVYGRDQMTVGVGAGQMSRVNSARIAAIKAEQAGSRCAGRDGLRRLLPVPGRASTRPPQPGIVGRDRARGSVRDEEVIAAADEHGMAMVFTGMRHFRH